MSDIFISYASEDRLRVSVIAEALKEQGWSVWWDRTIPFGKTFHGVIEEELGNSRCVLVAWSQHSIHSTWVKAEAEEGRKRGILFPILIEDVEPPLVFRQIQTANLSDWQGDVDGPVFRKLLSDIEAFFQAARSGQEEREAQADEPVSPDHPGRENIADSGSTTRKRKRRSPLAAISLVSGMIAAVTLGILFYHPHFSDEPPVIVSFEATPANITLGDTATLSWRTDNAGSIELSQIGIVSQAGSRQVRPDESMVFTLTARNASGELVQQEVEVHVEIPLPEILEFRIEPARISKGDSAVMHWRTSNAHEVELKGAGALASSGKRNIKPSKSTVYTLFVRNREGRSIQTEVEIAVIETAPADEEKEALEKYLEQTRWAMMQGRMEEAAGYLARARTIAPDAAPVIQADQEYKTMVVAEIRRKEEQQRQLQIAAAEERAAEEDRRSRAAALQLAEDSEARQKEKVERQRKLEEEKRAAEEESISRITALRLAEEAQALQQDKVARQQKLDEEKRTAAAATRRPTIVVYITGLSPRYERYGLAETSLRRLTEERLRKAGYQVITHGQAVNTPNVNVMYLDFHAVLDRSLDLYSYSASVKLTDKVPVEPARAPRSNSADWSKGDSGRARGVELRKVNGIFLDLVDTYIAVHR